jgi:hypothetical protein
MKTKTGLHKRVAFIFDGSPAAPQPAETIPTPVETPGEASPQSASSSVGGSAAAKNTAAKSHAKSGTRQVKTAGKQIKKDPKQAKMLALIGVLSVVLVAVLFFVLSSPVSTPPKTAAAAQSAEPQAPSAGTPGWTRPEPWPKQIRDPMTVGAFSQTNEGSQSECIVRGIVYSQTRPSAIIGNQIVLVGDTINGMTVIDIGRDSVVLERDGQRWTQQVQQ